jgi:rhamnogalacturonyl hydrolase YesR
MKERILLVSMVLFGMMKSFGQAPIDTKDIFKSMQKVANWQISSIETNGWRYPSTDWTNGAYYAGQMAWAKMANDDKQLSFLKSVGEKNNWKGGPQRFFADDYCVGQTYAELFMLYKDSAMIKSMIGLGDDILKQPHNEPLLWDFDGGLHNREWAWCDALFMGPPTLSYLYKVTGDQKYIDGMNKLWWKSTNFLYDTSENLYFRDSRFFEKREKNGAKVFWSRGNGWVIAGITRILDNLPVNYPERKGYEKIFLAMARRIASLQQPDGTWHASLLDPESYPIKETSGTAFFSYALSWGINHGYLSYDEYFPTVKRAWDALNNCVHENGKLGFVQVPGAAPEKVTFDDSEVYGVGAYLLAGTELFKMMFEKESAAKKIIVTNTLPIDRTEEISELSWAGLSIAKFKPSFTVVINAQTGEEIPSQITYDENKVARSLIFQSGVSAGCNAYFYLKKQKPKEYAVKTFGRLVPERLDDFAWENERIAFRMYGPALQNTGEISSGIDVWAKRTSDLVINKWYKSGDYHHDRGEGLDFYGVGPTLGAGGIAPLNQDTLCTSANFSSYKILNNGPLLTSFQLSYKPWNVGKIMVSEVKTISLYAGSYLNKVEVKYTSVSSELPVAIGIAKLPEQGLYWDSTSAVTMAAYQQPAQENGTISIGVVTPEMCKASEIPITKIGHYKHTGHFIFSTNIQTNKPFVYYQGACWDKQGVFQNFEQWKQYLQTRQVQMSNPLITIVKSKIGSRRR